MQWWVLCLWAAAVAIDSDGDGRHVAQFTAAVAVGWTDCQLRKLQMQLVQHQTVLSKFVRLRRPLLKWDRQQTRHAAAAVAQAAAEHGGSKKLYSIGKSLASKPPTPIKGIKNEDGDLITDAAQSRDRWRRHFAALFKAEEVEDLPRQEACIHDATLL